MKWLISAWGDPSVWKEVEYNYKGNSIKSANYLGLIQEVESPDETLIIVGDSLAYPSVVGEDVKIYDGLREKLENYIRKQYFEKFQIKSAKLLTLPGGRGTYFWRRSHEYLTIEGKSKDLKFVTLWNFIQLLEKNLKTILEKRKLEVIFDATHGWNFVPIMVYQTLGVVLEIISFFGVDVTFKMIASEPFVDENTPLNVVEIEERKISPGLYRYKTKEGYKSALKPTEYGKRNGKLLGDLKRFINHEYKGAVVNDIPLIIGAFYNGLPLAVKTFYTPTARIKPLIDKLFEVYYNGITLSVEGNKTVIRRALFFHPYTEVLLISYLYNLLTEALSDSYFLERKDVSLKELRNFACKLFAKDEKKLIAITKELGDCEDRTKGEIASVVEKLLKEGKSLNYWKRLKELIEGEEENEGNAEAKKDKIKKESIAERNFLAHAGLSRAEIEVKYTDGDIFIRYSSKRLEEIKKWVQKGLTQVG